MSQSRTDARVCSVLELNRPPCLSLNNGGPLSNSATGGDKPQASLADSEAYKGALDAAGVKGDVTGLAWVDIAGTLKLAQSFGATLNAEQQANTAPLRGVVYWGSQDGDTTKADLFVQVAK